MENEYHDMSMVSMRYYLPKSKSAISVKYSKNDYVVIKKEFNGYLNTSGKKNIYFYQNHTNINQKILNDFLFK